MRRGNSESDSTSTGREAKRLLLLLLGVALAVSAAWFALSVIGSVGSGSGGGLREAILRAVGFGSALIVGWVAVFIFALAFRREWLSRYNLWLGSAALTVAAIGALSFLSPSEGLLGWFALGGEVTPGGWLGDTIIGSQGWTGWLRVLAVTAVGGALFALPLLGSARDAISSPFGRREEEDPEPFAAGIQFSEDEQREADTIIAPVPVPGESRNPTGFAGDPSSWYTNSEPVWAREAVRTRPSAESDAPYADSSPSRSSEIFGPGNMPIRSAPVPSLANYLEGMTGSDSVESRIKSALAAPPEPEPEPAASESEFHDDDPFRPLNLNRLPEPVFAFSPEPTPTPTNAAVAVEEPETPDFSASEAPDAVDTDMDVPELSESSDAQGLADQSEYAQSDPDEEFSDDEDFDLDNDPHTGTANGSHSAPVAALDEPPIVVADEADSGSVVISDSGQDDFFMSQFNSTPSTSATADQPSNGAPYADQLSEPSDLVLDDLDRGDPLTPDLDSPSGDGASSPLLDFDDSDRGDVLVADFDSPDGEPSGRPRDDDSSDVGDSFADWDSSATIVDVTDQATFDDSVVKTTSMTDDEPESVVMEEFDPDYLDDEPEPPRPPSGGALKTNKYWGAIESDLASAPGSEAGASESNPTQSSWVETPVIASWRKPSVRMLNTAPSNSITEEEQQTTARAITRTLAEYGIEVGVEVGDIRPGPTVTMYGLTPGWVRKNRTVKQVDADGTPLKDERGRLVTKQVEEKTRVKVDSILAREKDLSLALKTPSIRLETPAMGKSLIGIEVPNPNPSLVTLRGIMESSEFQDIRGDGAHLPVALGQGSGGEPVVFDLAKMPHLLVAGATGSGKSVCLNAIVSCLITEKTPAEMRMLLVDPKRVELTPYNGIPHLLAPVIVETDTVVGYLKGLIREMFDRYRRMEEVGVRNIEAYNNRMPDKMPFLCVVIDELADLMMTAAVDVEQSICRLAQLGRATGIHMIIATQRPSVDVLTGLIKANFPSRISFGVTSQVDSRTILDTGGADKLLGRGDMLYLPLDASKPSRVQSVFIGDSEIEKLVGFWQSSPKLPLEEIDLLGGGEDEADETSVADDPDRDEMMDKAVELALSHRKLSTSLLQRRLRIGYPRAARLMDQLEEEGIVGPGDGSKSRDVIINQN